jgi:hypothetical protein
MGWPQQSKYQFYLGNSLWLREHFLIMRLETKCVNSHKDAVLVSALEVETAFLWLQDDYHVAHVWHFTLSEAGGAGAGKEADGTGLGLAGGNGAEGLWVTVTEEEGSSSKLAFSLSWCWELEVEAWGSSTPALTFSGCQCKFGGKHSLFDNEKGKSPKPVEFMSSARAVTANAVSQDLWLFL